MRASPIVIRSGFLCLLALLFGACAGPSKTGQAAPPVPQVAVEEAGTPPTPLLSEPPANPSAFGGHVKPTEIVAPDSLPDAEGEGILRFELLEPSPECSPERFAKWSALIQERFLGDPSPDRLIELDTLVSEIPVIDAMPAFINSLHGLDMADPDDIVRAAAIAEYWYIAQVRYKQVVLNGNPAAVLPLHVRNRMIVVDAWIRLWKRTVAREGGVARLRAQVAKLIADRKASREKQQREYEEKVRLREEERARVGESDGEDEPR